MRKADFQARIKKIEIVNKVLNDGWAQTIRVQLDDIDLTNENLLELRQFRPNEQVKVIIEPVQLTLFDTVEARAQSKTRSVTAPTQKPALDNTAEDYLVFTEEAVDQSVEEPPPGKVVREFKV